MKLSGPHFKQLQAALLDAYTAFGLRQMLRVQMDVDLDRVAGGDDLTEITFNLIRWAERSGQVARLIEAAYAGNRENPLLVALAADASSWFADQSEAPKPLDDLSPGAPQTSHQVFLSYSRKDSRQMQVVHRVLTDAGISVWTDEGLAVGTHSWEDAIERAIDEAGCMVVLMSPDAKRSKWVQTEVSYAQDIGLGVFPILLREKRRKSIPLTLWTVQYEDGRKDLPAACHRLVSALLKADVRPQHPPETISTPQTGEMREFGGIPFVYVPAGKFEMGSNENDYNYEQPIHTVHLDSYWIMQTEVTNAQYAECVDTGACRKPDSTRWNNSDYSDHPVTNVSWDDAVAYAEWLNNETGRTMRLPTEAEWEKAARGVDGRTYPWGNALPDSSLLNYGENKGGPTPVGSYPGGTSPYGALDMAGNVWEWTADWYDSDYYASSPERNPLGPESGDLRVVRGGSWNHHPSCARAPNRLGRPPGPRYVYLGFRLASPGF